VGASFSAPAQTGPWAHPTSCTMDAGSFPGVKSGRGVLLTPHPFYFRGQERIELYLYSPHGPYGLYIASKCLYKGAFYLLPYRRYLWLPEIARDRMSIVSSVLRIDAFIIKGKKVK